MCNCKNVEMGSYDNQVLLGYYPVMQDYYNNRIKAGLSGYGIPVDRCIVAEVIELWEANIQTYGCCCGHNKVAGFINVGEEDFNKAITLGWVKYEFKDNPKRCDTVMIKNTNKDGRHLTA